MNEAIQFPLHVWTERKENAPLSVLINTQKERRKREAHSAYLSYMVFQYWTDGIEWIVGSIVITPHPFVSVYVCGNGLLLFFPFFWSHSSTANVFGFLCFLSYIQISSWIAYHRMIIKNRRRKKRTSPWTYGFLLVFSSFFCSFHNLAKLHAFYDEKEQRK